MTDVEEKLAELTARRAARKAAQSQAAAAQKVTDLEALDELEIKHGDENVAALDVQYVSGLPTVVAVRTPKPAELKRYRARVKGADKNPELAVQGAIELAKTCLVYPDSETFARMAEARPNLEIDAGTLALNLCISARETEKKE